MRSAAVFSPRHSLPALRQPAQTCEDLSGALCEYTGKRFAVLCSSGSAALYMAIKASGARFMDIPASTFPAIHEACKLAGVPAYVHDCDLDTWHTQFYGPYAVSPVHNYGTLSPHPTRVDTRHVIVDAAAAMLTPDAFVADVTYCVSFNWNKSVSGGGGGAVMTDDEKLAERMEGMKRHVGDGAFNFQLPAPCAAEAFNQLSEHGMRQQHLRDLSEAYDHHLGRHDLLAYPKGPCRWLTATMLRDEAAVFKAIRALERVGKYVARRAWLPLSSASGCPNAWEIYRRGIVLPGGYNITPAMVEDVCGIVAEANR